MSIKPVDYQILIPKTSEISKIQNDNQHKNAAAQQQQNISNQHKAEDSVNLVHSQESPQKAAIREKEKEKKKKNSDKRSTGRKYKHKKDSENSTSTIDIRL
ncbi:MAG TPA: hypothetical protein GX727_04640 [Clostridium sp.]|jgi:hypothetical protein|nr:hypothetical protein [Clostridium sp.]